MDSKKPETLSEYVASFPLETQQILRRAEAIIREECPEAQEAIRYGMPTFIWHEKYLIHYAAYKKHLGVYPVPTAGTDLIQEFNGYITTGRGTIQFPLKKPLPVDLFRKIIRYRMQKVFEK